MGKQVFDPNVSVPSREITSTGKSQEGNPFYTNLPENEYQEIVATPVKKPIVEKIKEKESKQEEAQVEQVKKQIKQISAVKDASERSMQWDIILRRVEDIALGLITLNLPKIIETPIEGIIDPTGEKEKAAEGYSYKPTKMSDNYDRMRGRFLLGTTSFLVHNLHALSELEDSMYIGDKIDWHNIAAVLDVLNPTEHSVRQSMGLPSDNDIVSTTMRKVLAAGDPKERERIEQEYIDYTREFNRVSQQNPNKTTIPGLTPVKEWFDRNQDMTDDTYLSEGLTWLADRIDMAKEYVPPVQTGSETADYLLNGSVELGSSIAASIITGKAVASPFSMFSKLAPGIAGSKPATIISRASMNVALTNGESEMQARMAYDESFNQLVDKAMSQEDKVEMEAYANGVANDVSISNEFRINTTTLDYIVERAKKEYRKNWLKNNGNPLLEEQIKKSALSAYSTALNVNGVNILLETYQSKFFTEGMLPARNLLTKPTKWQAKQSVKAGISEYFEENINSIATNAGIAEAKGEGYSINDALGYIASKNGFEDGAWGFVGGHSQATVTSRTTYNRRLTQYEEQQKVIEIQNEIGNAAAENVEKIMSMDNSVKGIIESSKKIKILKALYQATGDQRYADMSEQEAKKIISNQAYNAFASGTTENLINNYKKIADSEKFTDEARGAARQAIQEINALEKIYNKTLNHSNQQDTYHNLVNQHYLGEYIGVLETGIDIAKDEALKEIANSEIINNTLGSFKDISDLPELDIDNLKNPYEGSDGKLASAYDNAIAQITAIETVKRYRAKKNAIKVASKQLADLKRDYSEMTSLKQQMSTRAVKTFYSKMAKYEKRRMKETNESADDYMRAADEFYLEKFDETLNDGIIGKFINEKDKKTIKENIQKEKEIAKEIAEIEEDERLDEAIKKQKAERDFIEPEVPAEKTQMDPVAAALINIRNNNWKKDSSSQSPIIGELFQLFDYIKDMPEYKQKGSTSFTDLAVEYNAAKKEGTNPEFVEAVENLLKKANIPAEPESKSIAVENTFTQESPDVKEAVNDIQEAIQRTIEEGLDTWDNMSEDPMEVPADLPDEMKEKLSNAVSTLYADLKEKKKNPTFDDLVRAYAVETSMSEAENHFELLKKGWIYAQLEGWKELQLNSDKVFNNIFKSSPIASIKEVANSLSTLNIAEQDELSKKAAQELKDDLATEYDDEITPEDLKITENPDVPLTGSTEDKLAVGGVVLGYQTFQVVQETDENGRVKFVVLDDKLTESQFVPDQQMLNDPSRYYVGSELNVIIPEEFMDMPVNFYSKTGVKGKATTFREWLETTNKDRESKGLPPLDENSREYRDKVPMMVIDKEGNKLAIIYDLDRINPNYVAPAYVERSAASHRNLRNSVFNSKDRILTVKITAKSEGHTDLNQIPNMGSIKISEGDPNSIIIVKKSGKTYYIKGQTPVRESQIVNSKPLFNGLPYELRQVGAREIFEEVDGKMVSRGIQPLYKAYPFANSHTISEDMQNTLYWAVMTYVDLLRGDNIPRETLAEVAKNIREITKNNIALDTETNVADFKKFIDMIVYTPNVDVKGDTTEKKIESMLSMMARSMTVNSGSRAVLFVQDGYVVAGTIYAPVVNSNDKSSYGPAVEEAVAKTLQSFKYIHPSDNADVKADFASFFRSILPTYINNVSISAMLTNSPVPVFDADGAVKNSYSSYDDYVRDNGRTNLKTIEIPINDNGTQKVIHATNYQYRIEVQPVNNPSVTDSEVAKATSEKEVSPSTAKKVADKISDQTPLTTNDEAIQNLAPEAVNNEIRDTQPKEGEQLFPFKGRMLTKQQIIEEIEKDKEALKYTKIFKKKEDSNESQDPLELTEGQINTLILSIDGIQGLPIHHQYQIINYIFNQASKIIGSTKNITISEKELLAAIRAQYELVVNSMKENTRATLASYEELRQVDPSLVDQEVIEGLEIQQEKLQIVDDNWSYFEEKALKMMKKFMNLKKQDYANNEDADNESEGEERYIEENTETEKGFTLTAEEINAKDTVSSDIKRFCQGIEEVNTNGAVRRGIFNLPIYVGYDVVSNTTLSILADTGASYSEMVKTLELFKHAYPWIKGLLEKLEDSSESLKNEFVSAMCKHALGMEFVMYSKTKSGRYVLNIYSTNSSAVVQSITTQWRNNIKSSGMMTVDPVDGEYYFSIESLERIMQEYHDLKSKAIPVSIPVGLRDEVAYMFVDYMKRNSSKEDPITEEEILKDMESNTLIFNMTPAGLRALKELTTSPDSKSSVAITKRNGKIYQFSVVNGQVQGKLYREPMPKAQAIQSWLENFGITVSLDTIGEILERGFKYDSSSPRQKNLFQGEERGKGEGTPGLLGTLYKTVANIHQQIKSSKDGKVRYDEEIEGTGVLGQTIIKSLASMESKRTSHSTIASFRDNKKTLYGYTATKYITDRENALKKQRDGKSTSRVLDQLLTKSYNNRSLWLRMLKQEAKFRDQFEVIHLGITTIKELGKQLYRDNSLQQLADPDHELVKLGFFMPTGQGTVDCNFYEGGLDFRIAKMFSPTMSDKSTMTVIKTLVLNLREKNMLNFDAVLEYGYDQLVLPDLQRIVSFNQRNKSSRIMNDKGGKYDVGAKLFYTIPSLNSMTFDIEGGKVSLSKMMEKYNVGDIENLKTDNGKTVKQLIKEEVNKYFVSEQQKKLVEWEKMGFIIKEKIKREEGESDESFQNRMDNRKYTTTKFIDHRYLREKSTNTNTAVNIAALDYVINSMVSNNNSYMTFTGDPALYYKRNRNTDPSDFVGTVRDTFTYMGKRLANQIAPGNKIADSDLPSSVYYQVFLADTERVSHRIKYITYALDGKEVTDEEIERYHNAVAIEDNGTVEEILSKYPKSKEFFSIEATNAQEYTTWREHLYILEKMGKMPEAVNNVTADDIKQAAMIFSSEVAWEDLTDKQKVLVQKVMQPMKPVYTGQIEDQENDCMRSVYIKTSSFPLIPQLTAGKEIDKLRKSMEALENDGRGMTVRASYQSGNKVGGLENPLSISDSRGNFIEFDADTMRSNSLVLNRSDFRIQQNIPYKSAYKNEDTSSMGTQTTKLAFGNGVMNLDGFDVDGTSFNGRGLQQMFTHLHSSMITSLRLQLYNEIGIDPKTGDPIAERGGKKAVMQRLSNILKEEALERGYPKQDIDALGIDPETGNFNLPLWLSPNSNRYEALLNSIISHRIVKIKYPGYSYVIGSENGFKLSYDISDAEVSMDQVVYTSNFDHSVGELKGNQVFIPCKIRVDGKLIDITSDEYSYRDPSTGRLTLREDKISTNLLSIPSFRIPTSKHGSMEKIEIAGFLPVGSADLMIVSMDGTVIIGEDYDIDKRYTYHYWTTVENGKIIPLNKSKDFAIESLTTENIELREKKIDQMIAEKRKDSQYLRRALKKHSKLTRELNSLLDEMDLSDEAITTITDDDVRIQEINKELDRLNVEEIGERLGRITKEINELKKVKIKLIQNDIISIHLSVFSHPEVQKKMLQKVTVEEARKDAEFLEEIEKEKNEDMYFTPVSDMYQRGKVIAGAIGKNGTAAYSLDVVSHSLFEQSANLGNVISLRDKTPEGEEIPFTVKFGSFESTGELGRIKTLGKNGKDGERDIAELHSERQNLMVDNESEQIAIRIHLNNYTMPVDKVLNFLGFDQDYEGKNDSGEKRSISFMFISQPIIKEFVKMMEEKSSNVAEYDPNKRKKVIEELIKKYGTPDPATDYDSKMTVNYMVEQIRAKEDELDMAFQSAVLLKFDKLADYAKQITNVQTTLNVDSKGIGKNLLEVLEKIETVKNLPENALVRNADKLIGEYYRTTAKLNSNEVLAKMREGFIVIDSYPDPQGRGVPEKLLIKPTTIAGNFTIQGLSSAKGIWGPYFPYTFGDVRAVMEEIKQYTSSGDISETKKVEIKQEIINEMKKYLYTDNYIGMATLTPRQERYRLYIDETESIRSEVDGKIVKTTNITKRSLASYMRDVLMNPKNRTPELDDFIKQNRLLQRLKFVVNTNGEASLIQFDNSSAENFDEEYLYNSIIEMIEANIPLPNFNKKPYSTLQLAQDLVLYEYMGSAVQEAIEFIKYIPVAYLKILGINNITGENGRSFVERDVLGVRDNEVSTFGMQFVQHHPSQVKRLTVEDILASNPENFTFKSVSPAINDNQIVVNNLNSLMKFQYDSDEMFLSIYNDKLPKGQNKFQLYIYDAKEECYVRIPVLGTFGMSEYSTGSRMTSLVNQTKIVYPSFSSVTNEDYTAPVEKRELSIPDDKFDLLSGDITKIVDNIAKMDSPMGRLAKKLFLITPKVKFSIKAIPSKGRYVKGDGITINPSVVLNSKNPEEIATVIMREVIHSIADDVLIKYTSENVLPTGERKLVLKPEAPQYIRNIVDLFLQAREKLDVNGELSQLIRKKQRDPHVALESGREIEIIYGGYNIREFVERMMTSPSFQKEMAQHTYKSSDTTLLERFWGVIKDMLHEIMDLTGLDYSKDSITVNTIANIFELIENVGDVEYTSNEELNQQTINKANALIDDLGIGITGEEETAHPDIDIDSETLGEEFFNNPLPPPSQDPLEKVRNFEKLSSVVSSLVEKGIITIKC